MARFAWWVQLSGYVWYDTIVHSSSRDERGPTLSHTQFRVFIFCSFHPGLLISRSRESALAHSDKSAFAFLVTNSPCLASRYNTATI